MITITTEEALARLVQTPMIEAHYEAMPNNGFTYAYQIQRNDVVESLMTAPQIFESGFEAQERDMGIHVPFLHGEYGPGLLFFKTRPECRLTVKDLLESVVRGKGKDIHCNHTEVTE